MFPFGRHTDTGISHVFWALNFWVSYAFSCGFLFGWQVHEKASLHFLLPLAAATVETIEDARHYFILSIGFPKRGESVHDAFGAGHSSTSISAGLGMAVGRDLLGKNNNVISVIGDGAMTAGQAYEAMNNAGYLDSNLVIFRCLQVETKIAHQG